MSTNRTTPAKPISGAIQARVLVVDDRADKLLAIEAILESLNVQLAHARSGPDALALCAQFEFAVILLDVRMPGWSGFETAARLRQNPRSARTPIIFMSAADSPGLMEEGYALGAVDYIHSLVPQILRAKVSVFVDLYQQRLEIEQRRANEIQLREQNSAKDRFIAVLSHELRTPLTPVVALLPDLIESEELSDSIRQDLQMIYDSVKLEARFINDLLDLSAISRGRFPLNLQKADVHLLVQHALQLVLAEAKEKQIELKVDLAAECSLLWADAARISQVIWNLLKNAIRYTPAGGAISVRSRSAEPQQLLLEVSDTGIGIEASDLHRIFEAFERPAEERGFQFGGLGLGLFIAKTIVQQHGGRLSAHSGGNGSGSTFRVELPLLQSPADAEENRQPLRETLRKRALKLLLIEDDEQTRKVITRLLQRRGHDVQAAADMKEALALAAGAPFDLIISDLGLPDGSGLELMPLLRSRYGLRGIALSGYGMEDDLQKSKAAGFEEHLVKPVDVETLEKTVLRVASPAKRPRRTAR